MQAYYDHDWGFAQHDEQKLFEMLCAWSAFNRGSAGP
ncbi:DNA-3-methyladenine glycosylase I [Limosilactobacillus fermentum]